MSAPNFALAPVCRSCGNHDSVKSQGKLQDAKLFAGTVLPAPLRGGTLCRCGDCGFVFRHPILAKEDYDKLYRSSTAESWDEAGRVDHDLVRAALRRHLGKGSVLDVGCGGGTLLEPLAGEFEIFGIEMNPDASRAAAGRGLKMSGSDLQAMTNLTVRFNAVVSCDVIEHLADPVDFLRKALSLTLPGGLVLVSSGNADAWSWRLAGSSFWYCYGPEHISFVSPNWFDKQAAALGTEIVAVQRFAYSPKFTILAKAARLCLMALYKISPTLYRRIQPAARRNNFPVGRGVTQDHFLVILRKRR
jgi:cyclopropane fatty-acyl-phospholipid synthase-like methyltransferase